MNHEPSVDCFIAIEPPILFLRGNDCSFVILYALISSDRPQMKLLVQNDTVPLAPYLNVCKSRGFLGGELCPPISMSPPSWPLQPPGRLAPHSSYLPFLSRQSDTWQRRVSIYPTLVELAVTPITPPSTLAAMAFWLKKRPAVFGEPAAAVSPVAY